MEEEHCSTQGCQEAKKARGRGHRNDEPFLDMIPLTYFLFGYKGTPYIQTITGGDAICYMKAYRNGGKKKTDTYMEKSLGSMIV